MDLDLSLIEISGEDDSLVRLDDPTDGIITCSPLVSTKYMQSDAASDLNAVGGVRSTRCTEKFGERSSKENIDVNVDGMKLNMDPLQMKRKKKAGGYNMRKSLAWNKAFFTEEGVLDPEELSLVTGTYNLSSGEPLSVIQEEKPNPGKRNSPHLQSPKEKLFMKSPGLERGLSPRCDSSSRYCGSPAKQISSPHVRRLVLSVQESNRKGEKQNGCPRPKPSSSCKRPATATTSCAISKEPKLTKSSVPRAQCCSIPMVPSNALSKASYSSRIPGADTKRVVTAPKPIASAVKGCSSNTRGIKGTTSNTRGIKGIANSVSPVKPSPSKEPLQLQGRNKSKLPPKVPTPRGLQAPQVNELKSAPSEVPDQVLQQCGRSNKHNHIPLPQKCMPNDVEQVAHVQVGKPTGLRMPSPSLGFFGRPKLTAPMGDTQLHNISESTAYRNYAGTRNLSVAQRPLQAPGKVSGISNGVLASDQSMCFSSNIREPLVTGNSVEMVRSIEASNSSQDVRTDILEKCSQTLPRDSDRESKKPAESIKSDERADMEPSHTYDDLQDKDESSFEQLECQETLEKANSSCRNDLINSLPYEGCSVSEAETQDCSGIQPITYENQITTHGSDCPSLERTETRKTDSGKAQQKMWEDSLDDQMDNDVSFSYPQIKCVEYQEVVNAPCQEDLKDSSSLECYSISVTETQDLGNHIQPLGDKKSVQANYQQSVEGTETRKPDFREAHQEEYKESLNRCTNYDSSLLDEPVVLDIKEHIFSIDCPEDCYLSEHKSAPCLSLLKSIDPASKTSIGEDINNKADVASHVHTPCKMNCISILGMLDGDISRSSYMATDETQPVVSELKASGNEQDSSEGVQLQTYSSDALQKLGVQVLEDAASGSHMNDKKPSCVGAELPVDCKIPSPHAESEHIVEYIHQICSECDMQPHMKKKDDLVDISICDLDEIANEEVLSSAQTEEIIKQPSPEHIETGSDIFLEELKTTELNNDPDLELLNLESIGDHQSGFSLDDTDKESEGVDLDELGKPSSQLAVLEQHKVVCRSDTSTAKAYAESLSSDKCSETCLQDSSEDQYGFPDAGLKKQSSHRSIIPDTDQLERDVTETAGSEDDTTCTIEVEHVHDDTASNLAESGAQFICDGIRSNSKPAALLIKPPPDVVPFSDEWLAAIECAGEDILTLKSGAVQHSPPDKTVPEPSPWSPVKRYKNQGIGPFDCTKHTNVLQPPY